MMSNLLAITRGIKPRSRPPRTLLVVLWHGLMLLGYLSGSGSVLAEPITIETETTRYVVRPDAGALGAIELKQSRFRDADGTPLNLVSTTDPAYAAFRVRVEDRAGREIPLTWRAETAASGPLLIGKGEDVSVERRLSATTQAYSLASATRVTQTGKRPRTLRVKHEVHHYAPSGDLGGGFLFAAHSHSTPRGVCREENETRRKEHDKLLTAHGYSNAKFAGVETAYFAQAVALQGEESGAKEVAERCGLVADPRDSQGNIEKPEGFLLSAWVSDVWTTLEPGQSLESDAVLFAGPKLRNELTAAGHDFIELLDLGFFASLSSWLSRLLAFIQGYVGNWGIAIILLTLLVKLVLYPLTEKSFQSMARMRELKPEIDRLNKEYEGDREKKGLATMELYRKHKINPLGGCLPSVLQIPIWFSLYTSLSTNVELYHAPFFGWLNDLSAPDPFFILPLALGGLMFVQQKMTPTAMDPAQAKMMLYVMPAMITAFMLFLPAGLCLYMVTNSGLSMGQQKLILVRQARSHTAPNTQSVNHSAPGTTAKKARSH